MMDHDAFSKWLGIEVIAVEAGSATLRMTVREEMTNGFGIAHGGISYSLADSALAFASNGGGNQSVSLETAIHHLKPVQTGDTLEARATLLNETRRTGLYQIDIFSFNFPFGLRIPMASFFLVLPTASKTMSNFLSSFRKSCCV